MPLQELDGLENLTLDLRLNEETLRGILNGRQNATDCTIPFKAYDIVELSPVLRALESFKTFKSFKITWLVASLFDGGVMKELLDWHRIRYGLRKYRGTAGGVWMC